MFVSISTTRSGSARGESAPLDEVKASSGFEAAVGPP